MPAPAVIDVAKPLAKQAFDDCFALDNTGPDSIVDLVLMEMEFVQGDGTPDESLITDNNDRVTAAYKVAYHLVLGAIDIARAKVDEAKGGPAEAKFRKEYLYLREQLPRLAARAGINDIGDPVDADPDFNINCVPHCPET